MKNIIKKLKGCFVLLLIVPLCLVFAACSNGLSAYEIAKKHGFVGTEQEWLESLKGENGKNGNDAPQESSYELWQQAVASGEYTGTYLEFINERLTINYDDIASVANKSMSSVVEISTGSSGGSGVIFSIDAEYNTFILTNYHVAYGYNNFTVSLRGNDNSKSFDASFVGGSATYDIAVLYAENCTVLQEYNASAAVFNTDDIKFGTVCYAIGNTNLAGLSISKGNVSVDSEERTVSVANTSLKHRLIRHNAYISNGNSGGGLFNNKGELIGITNGGLQPSSTSSNELMNLAIPASIVKYIATNIIENCFGKEGTSAKVANIGLGLTIAESSGHYNSETGFIDITEVVKISSVSNTSPFAEDLAVGDTLKQIKVTTPSETTTKQITRKFNYEDLILLLTDGCQIELTVSRAGEENDIVVSANYSAFEILTIS